MVFSCGAGIASRRPDAPRPLLITAFLSGRDADVRRREDEQAAAILRCDYRCLELPDGLDRPEINGTLGLFSPFGPQHLGITNEVVTRVLPLIRLPAILYAPLAVGGHIDHRIAHEAARAVAYHCGPALQLVYYEDLPYALVPYAVARRLAVLDHVASTSGRTPDLQRGPAAAERAAYRAWLLSCPHMARYLPGARWIAAHLAAGAAVQADALLRPHHRPGFPPKLRPLFRTVDAGVADRQRACAAYASQWPLFALTAAMLAQNLDDYGRNTARAAGNFPSGTVVDRLWRDVGVYGPVTTDTHSGDDAVII